MTLPTSGSQTELQAVNEILASVGQAPVTTLEQTNPDVAIAYNTLLEVNREVQAEGWTFNKEENIPWKLNTDKEIEIPENVLQMDLNNWHLSNRGRDTVRRDGKLYDRFNHTFEFDDDPTYVDVTYILNWLDLPPAIQSYITARAASIVSMRIVGDSTQYQILQQKEAYCRTQAMEYECNQGDYSMFGFPQGNDYYVSYKPFHTLRR